MKLRNILIILMFCVWVWPVFGQVQGNVEGEAGAIARELGAIYGRVTRYAATTQDIADLSEQLERLVRLEPSIVGSTKWVKSYALQYRTLAWIQGWAAFSQVLSQGQGTFTSEERRHLLSLQDRSVFKLLLEIYRQMWNAQEQLRELVWRPFARDLGNREGTAAFLLFRRVKETFLDPKTPAEPLYFGLGRSQAPAFAQSNRYQEPWPPGACPVWCAWDYFISAHQDILGNPGDDADLGRHRQLLSLWAIVNLQLDNWRDQPDNAEQLDFTHLKTWLAQLAASELLRLHDEKGVFTKRLQRLAQFLSFRQYAADNVHLHAMVKAVSEFRSKVITGTLPLTAKALCASIPNQDCRSHLEHLFAAGEPLEQEAVQDAGLWLRYIILLSYERQSLTAIFGDAPTNLDSFSQQLMETPVAFLDGLSLPKERRPGKVFLRWHGFPGSQHYNTAMTDMMWVTYQYLRLQQKRLQADCKRFQMYHLRRFRKAYGEALLVQSQDVTAISDRLSIYLTPGSRLASNLSSPHVPAHIAWGFSCTQHEQERMLQDIAGLANTVLPLRQQIELAAYALQSEGEDCNAVMKALGASASLNAWDPHAYPQKSFAAYAKDVKEAAATLEREIAALRIETELQHEFDQKLLYYGQLRLQAKIGKIGAEISKKARAVAQIYQDIAAIEKDMCDLQQEIAVLGIKEAESNEKAKVKAMEYATWMRDLAIAHCQALEAAMATVKDQVAAAMADMQNYSDELKSMAGRIQEENEKKSFFSVIKAVVSIAGAVAAPFLGEGSVAVASIINKVIDVVQIAEKTDWKNFGQAVGAMVKINATAQSAIAIGMKEWGKPEDVKKFEKLREEINSHVKLTQASVKLGKSIYDGIQNKDDFFKIAACVASQFPSRYNKKTHELEFTFGGRQIEIELPDKVQQTIDDIVESGGLFAQQVKGEVEPILEKVENLPKMEQEFVAMLQNKLKQLPDEMLVETVGEAKADELRAKFKKARNAAVSTYRNLPQDQQAAVTDLLGHIMEKGMPIIKAGNKLVAIEKDIHKDLLKLQERARSIQEIMRADANDTIRKVLDRLQGRRQEVQTQVQQAGEDVAALNNLAEQVIPAQIDKMQQELQILQDEIGRAQAKVKETEMQVEIASYEAEASTARKQISELLKKVRDMEAMQATKNLEAKRIETEMAELGVEKSTLWELCADSQARACWEDIQFLYQKCLDSGFDPISRKRIVPHPGLIRLLDSVETRNGMAVRGATRALFGMLQWLALLSPGEQSLPVLLGFYEKLLKASLATALAETHLVKAQFEALQQAMQEQYDALVSRTPQFGFLINERFTAQHQLGKWQKEGDNLVYGFKFQIVFAKSPQLPVGCINQYQVAEDKFYYVRFANIHLLLAQGYLTSLSNKRFEVIPPLEPKANYQTLVGMTTARAEAQGWSKEIQVPYQMLRRSLNELYPPEDIGKLILGYIKDDPQLIPAVGEWEFKIVFENEWQLTLEDVEKLGLQFDLYMGVLVILPD